MQSDEKVKAWLNQHQDEFKKRQNESQKININLEQQKKIINNLKEELSTKYFTNKTLTTKHKSPNL